MPQQHVALLDRAFANSARVFCEYCGQQVFRGALPTAPNRATVDHRIPRARGGRNTASNYAIACHSCNHRKGNLTEAEFRFVMNNAKALDVMRRSIAARFTPEHVPLTKEQRAERDAEKRSLRLQRFGHLAESDCESCAGTGAWQRGLCRCVVNQLRDGRTVPRYRTA